jgi:hypothetical protein
MNPPQLNFNALSNIERTIRANDKNMQSIAPRVNLNIDNRMNHSGGNDRLSDDELGMDILANPKVTRRKSVSSNVDLSTPVNNFSNNMGNNFSNDIGNNNGNNFGNSNQNININREDDIDLDDDLESVHSHHSDHSDQSQSNLRIPNEDMFGSRRSSINSNDRSSINSSDYDEPKSPRTVLREKRKLLFKLKRYEKKGYKLSAKFSIHTPLEEIQCEYETIRKESNLENSLKVSKNILISVCSVLEFLNNKFDPLDIVLDGWSEEINEDVEQGDYDEVLEDLYDKYADTVEMGPEIKLLMMIGGSAVKFHLCHTVLKTIIPGAETLLKQNPGLKSDIASLIQKNVPELNMDNLNVMPKSGDRASGLGRSSQPRREMQGPTNVDDIIRELEENDFDNMSNVKQNDFTIGKRPKKTISLDL